jgi:hypothetical protein
MAATAVAVSPRTSPIKPPISAAARFARSATARLGDAYTFAAYPPILNPWPFGSGKRTR